VLRPLYGTAALLTIVGLISSMPLGVQVINIANVALGVRANIG
jgi:hypothetical protein